MEEKDGPMEDGDGSQVGAQVEKALWRPPAEGILKTVIKMQM